MTDANTSMERQTAGGGEDPDAVLERLHRTIELLQGRIRRLEEENALLADRLKERGVKVRSSSQIALELPPPVTVPKHRTDAIMASMTAAEQALCGELAGQEEIVLLLKTNSKTDTGYWLRQRRLWIGVTANGLFMFAPGRKPMMEKVEFRYLQQSLYNHVMGELVLAPTRELKLSRIRVSHEDGYQILAQIYRPSSLSGFGPPVC